MTKSGIIMKYVNITCPSALEVTTSVSLIEFAIRIIGKMSRNSSIYFDIWDRYKKLPNFDNLDTKKYIGYILSKMSMGIIIIKIIAIMI